MDLAPAVLHHHVAHLSYPRYLPLTTHHYHILPRPSGKYIADAHRDATLRMPPSPDAHLASRPVSRDLITPRAYTAQDDEQRLRYLNVVSNGTYESTTLRGH